MRYHEEYAHRFDDKAGAEAEDFGVAAPRYLPTRA
jgi:hypothetical protein